VMRSMSCNKTANWHSQESRKRYIFYKNSLVNIHASVVISL
jgi:hypothetical protein